MQRTKLAATAIAIVLMPFFSYSAVAQASHNTDGTSLKRVYGYVDPATGEFHSLRQVVPEATTAPTTGTVDVTLTITLKTAVPKGGVVLCHASLLGDKVVSGTTISSYSETATTEATVSGSTANCTVTIPYSWALAGGTALQESFSGSYDAEIVSPISTQAILSRTSAGTYVSSTTIPASGSTTKYSLAVTL